MFFFYPFKRHRASTQVIQGEKKMDQDDVMDQLFSISTSDKRIMQYGLGKV